MKEVKIGVPQGSVLGSILFSLYINDIDTSSPEAKIVLFADDTVMLFSSEGSLEDFNNKITRGLLGVGRWLLLNKLTLNVQKTTAISFHNNEKLNLSLNNEEIRQVETAKYVGIIISKNLKWSEHIKLLADKMVSGIRMIRKLRNTLPKRALWNLYYTLIHCNIMYCPEVWGDSSKKDLNRIHKLQKRALNVLGACDWSQVNVLNIDQIIRWRLMILMYYCTV